MRAQPSIFHPVRNFGKRSSTAPLDGRGPFTEAVVVAQHDHRHAGEFGIEHPLARAIEAVAVDEGDGASAADPGSRSRSAGPLTGTAPRGPRANGW